MLLQLNGRSTRRLRFNEVRDILGGHWGGMIQFVPPPPVGLAGGSWWEIYRNTWLKDTDCALGGCREIQWWPRWMERQELHFLEMLAQIDIISLYKIQTLSFPAFGPMHSCRAFKDPSNWCGSFYGQATFHSLWSSCCAPRARIALSHQFPLDGMSGGVECHWWALCFLAPQIHHTVIVSTERWTWGPLLSKFKDAHGGQDGANSVRALEAVIEQMWYTKFRLYLSQLLAPCTLAEPSRIQAIVVVPLTCRQPFTAANTVAVLPEPESHFHINSLWMPWEVGWSVTDGLSAF